MCSGTAVRAESLDLLVVAVCADYDRRLSAIKERSVSHRTEMEYRYLNYRVYLAAAEIVGDLYAPDMIREIGARRGYAKSAVEDYSERTYKVKKQQIKMNIAKKLHLID
ncbi:MAG: hypothetical protein IJE25_03965 [Clostridia bacterium]|nr:hypothetical protein [Clostridia bacterium]